MKAHLSELGPYRGTQSHSSELLILTESFYIEGRGGEIDASEWYSKGTSLLNDEERTYVNYQEIFRINKLPDGRWKSRGCAIYRNLESALLDAGFPPIHNMLNHCTLANCFLRPALNGDSLQIQAVDCEFAKDYLIELVGQLKPKVIICASSKSYNRVVRHIQFDCKVINTSHPACVWWNRDGGAYGRKKFVEAAGRNLTGRRG
jgi:hypothetical protein